MKRSNRSIVQIRQAADEDVRFAFAMAMFADAAYEPNPLFKVCRLFNVLESLAYALKNNVGSRRAVKIMLGLEDGAMCNVQVDGREISYDRIEIAGRLRDKLFHGTPFREQDLIPEARPVFHLIEHRPEMIADTLLADCETRACKMGEQCIPRKRCRRGSRRLLALSDHILM